MHIAGTHHLTTRLSSKTLVAAAILATALLKAASFAFEGAR
jgi:hypothetical protein